MTQPQFFTDDEMKLPLVDCGKVFDWYTIDTSKIRFQHVNTIFYYAIVCGVRSYPMFYVEDNAKYVLRINGTSAIEHSKHASRFEDWCKVYFTLSDSYYNEYLPSAQIQIQ